MLKVPRGGKPGKGPLLKGVMFAGSEEDSGAVRRATLWRGAQRPARKRCPPSTLNPNPKP